jgi:hypothetical protein
VLGFGQIGRLDLNQLEKGVLGYQLDSQAVNACKLLIQKQGINYFYDISNSAEEYFPLQMGNGDYKIILLEKISGSSYKVVQSNLVALSLKKSEDAFLGSVQNICWSTEDLAIKKAAQLTEGLQSDYDKIQAIYDYVVENITYDQVKARSISSGYVPDINDTYYYEKGICYDYSALFAAMLRSVGVPAKLVMGKSRLVKDTYHAWNEVFLETEGKWIVMDTTIDAALRKASKSYSAKKSCDDYTPDKFY